MHGNFNILTSEEIQLFENKYKIEKYDLSNILVATKKTKNIYSIYSDLVLRVKLSSNGCRWITISTLAIKETLLLNRIMKNMFGEHDFKLSVFKIQNIINQLKSQNKIVCEDTIEQEFFKNYQLVLKGV